MKPSRMALVEDSPSTILEAFIAHHVPALLHYTPVECIPQILTAAAILSRLQQTQRGLETAVTHGWGGKLQALADYICCGLAPCHGMLRSAKQPLACLIVAPQAATATGTLFSPINSARDAITVMELLARGGREGLDTLFHSPSSPILRNTEAEVLIPGTIELRLVQRIVFSDRAALRHAAHSCRMTGRWQEWLGWRRPQWIVDDGSLFP